MKKMMMIALALVMVFTFTACANNTPAPTTPEPAPTTPAPTTPDTTAPGTGTEPANKWKDGSYTGVGDKWQYGNEDATVIVADGKISQVTLRRLTTDNAEVNYDEWTGADQGAQTKPNLKQFREDLAQDIVQAQGTEGVDEIAGATVSTKNWKLAVERALEQAELK